MTLFPLFSAGDWAFRGTEDIPTSFSTPRRQDQRFQAGSVPHFTNLKKLGELFMRFNKPEAQMSREIVKFSRKIRYVLQALFLGLQELLRPRISDSKTKVGFF